MAKKHSREKQAVVLRRTQEKRKQQKKEQVLRAIQEILAQGKPLTFPNIAKVAGCSVSYLYKWDEITAYIHELQNKKETQLHQLKEEKPKPHGLKTLHEVSKQRIRELEAEIKELKRQNEKLRGHVAEIYELRDECERLRTQLRELTSPQPSTKVVPIQVTSSKTANTKDDDIPPEIAKSIKAMGIKLGVRLKQEIRQHDPEKVRLAVEAFEQYRSQTAINSPGACLLAMIRDEAESNVPQNAITPEEDEFDRWYNQAITVGFCQDIPKNYLPIKQGEIMVRVDQEDASGEYELMSWRDAKALMESADKF